VKAAVFHPKARRDVKAFPEAVRRQLGKTIFDLQKGHHIGMPLARPIPEVAPGVEELRVRDPSGIYRAFFYKRSTRGILILHAFEKKTQTTPLHEMQIAGRRLKEMLHEEEK